MARAWRRGLLPSIGRVARATPYQSRCSDGPVAYLRAARRTPARTYAAGMLTRARARLTAWRARFGPRAADVLAILLALGVGIAQLTDDPAKSFPNGKPASCVVLVLSAGLLWWRRRWPIAVTLVGCAAFAVSNLPMTAFIGLTTLAVR